MFDGRGSSFLDFEQQVFLRIRTAKADFAIRAYPSALHLRSAPREVCIAAGADFVSNQDGAARISDILRKFFAPDAADAIHQQATRFSHPRRAGQSIDEFIAEFDLPRRKAESEMDRAQEFQNSSFRYCA